MRLAIDDDCIALGEAAASLDRRIRRFECLEFSLLGALLEGPLVCVLGLPPP